ncbi:MAG: hypothetical protein ABIS38_06485 [Sphingomicrobium sp.]
MNISRFSLAVSAAALAIVASVAVAQGSGVMTTAAPGLWELSGMQGARSTVRECVASVAALAQYEHRGRSCPAKVLSDSGKVAVVYYTCAGSDFGRTSLKIVTPRNLKIDTQGISDGLPFAYAFEARRVGECKAAGSGGTERGH